jgi:hypothetical protein
LYTPTISSVRTGKEDCEDLDSPGVISLSLARDTDILEEKKLKYSFIGNLFHTFCGKNDRGIFTYPFHAAHEITALETLTLLVWINFVLERCERYFSAIPQQSKQSILRNTHIKITVLYI